MHLVTDDAVACVASHILRGEEGFAPDLSLHLISFPFSYASKSQVKWTRGRTGWDWMPPGLNLCVYIRNAQMLSF